MSTIFKPTTPEQTPEAIAKRSAVINNEKHRFITRKTKSGKIQKIPTDFDKKLSPRPGDLGKILLPGKNNAKIRKAFELCVKYDGDITRAAQEAGYSPHLVENPGRLLKTKAWHTLTEYYFPTYYLFEKERHLLESKDNTDIHKSLDRIHKLKGNFNRNIEIKLNPTGEISQKSNEELQRIADGDVELEPLDVDVDDGTIDEVDSEANNINTEGDS